MSNESKSKRVSFWNAVDKDAQKSGGAGKPAAKEHGRLGGPAVKFTSDAVRRESQKNTVSIKIKTLEEFEDNPRQEFDKEELAQLQSSLRNNGEIDQIQVVHVVKGDRYIIADGHRTKRAMEAEFGEDHKTEVIVQREFQEYDIEAREHLLRVGIVTSNTKVNLKVWEQLEAAQKYVDILSKRDPSREWAITQKEVYEALGLSKPKAMRLGQLATLTKDQWKSFGDQDVSQGIVLAALKITRSADEGMKKSVLKEMESGGIKSTMDVDAFREEYDKADLAIPKNSPDREEAVHKLASDSFKKAKRASAEVDGKASSHTRAACAVGKLKKKLQELVAVVDPAELDDATKSAYVEALVEIRKTSDDALKAARR